MGIWLGKCNFIFTRLINIKWSLQDSQLVESLFLLGMELLEELSALINNNSMSVKSFQVMWQITFSYQCDLNVNKWSSRWMKGPLHLYVQHVVQWMFNWHHFHLWTLQIYILIWNHSNSSWYWTEFSDICVNSYTFNHVHNLQISTETITDNIKYIFTG